MKLAVVGATGLVGNEMIRVLEERNMMVDEFMAVASNRSKGKKISFNGRAYDVIGIEEAIALRPDIALFSAGSSTSLKWAPEFAARGTWVIDNSSAWRQHKDVPLVVPEINPGAIGKDQKIISNPNCSTIQLVMALAPLHEAYRIKRVVVSTYQSVSGSGMKGVRQLEDERQGVEAEKAYPHRIDLNVIPQAGDFETERETSEELKLSRETQKILDDPEMKVSATAVRVPVTGGHSEAVNVEFENDFMTKDIFSLLRNAEGITIQDDPAKNIYPTPIQARGSDEVYIGRIRRDNTVPYGLNLWIVSDNLRKGAATNAVQIAELLINKGMIGQ